MDIDLSTYAIVLAVINALQLFVIYSQYRINRNYHGLGWWSLTCLTYVAGYLLLLFRVFSPQDLISIFFSNSIFVVAVIFEYVGVKRFLDEREDMRIILATIPFILLTTLIFFRLDLNLNVWYAFFSTLGAVYSLITAWALFHARLKSIKTSTWFLALIFLLYGLFLVFRTISLVTILPGSYEQTGYVMQVALFMVPLIQGILVTFGLIIMVNQRLNADMREARDHFELIFHTSPEAVIVTRLSDGNIVNVNEGFTRLTGFSREDVLGKSIRGIDFGEDFDYYDNVFNQMAQSGYCDSVETSFPRRDGNMIVCTISASRIYLQGVAHVTSILHDITTARQAELALRQARDELEARVEERTRELADLNASLEQIVADRTRKLSTLYDVSMVTSRSVNSLDAMMSDTLERTLSAINAKLGAIYLLEREEAVPDYLRITVQKGFNGSSLPAIVRLTDEGGAGIPDSIPSTVERITHQTRLGLTSQDGKELAVLVAPMLSEGQVMGAMILARNASQGFTGEETQLLTSIAEQVGVAVANDNLQRRAILLDERQRIARDLHDSVTQSLYGLVTLAEAGLVQLKTDPPEQLKHTFTLMGETARGAIKELRLFIHELNPPALEQVGLIGALLQRLDMVEGRSNVNTQLLADANPNLSLADQKALYQVAQEALNNIFRHARAKNITIYVRCLDGMVEMEIVDDGCGFDPGSVRRGMGLKNMNERMERMHGKIEIESVIGAGTRVKISAREAALC